MNLREAHARAAELNCAEQAKGSNTRYVVVAEPLGSCGGAYQCVARRVGRVERPAAVGRSGGQVGNLH